MGGVGAEYGQPRTHSHVNYMHILISVCKLLQLLFNILNPIQVLTHRSIEPSPTRETGLEPEKTLHTDPVWVSKYSASYQTVPLKGLSSEI